MLRDPPRLLRQDGVRHLARGCVARALRPSSAAGGARRKAWLSCGFLLQTKDTACGGRRQRPRRRHALGRDRPLAAVTPSLSTPPHPHTSPPPGPFFKDVDYLDFYNLELADTNVVDHNTHK